MELTPVDAGTLKVAARNTKAHQLREAIRKLEPGQAYVWLDETVVKLSQLRSAMAAVKGEVSGLEVIKTEGGGFAIRRDA